MLLTMESKTAAAHKLEQLIVQGRTKAGDVVDHVMNHQPSDRLARGGELSFAPDPETNTVLIDYPDPQATSIRQRLHRHSVQQMAQNHGPVSEVHRRFAADVRPVGTRIACAQSHHHLHQPLRQDRLHTSAGPNCESQVAA